MRQLCGQRWWMAVFAVGVAACGSAVPAPSPAGPAAGGGGALRAPHETARTAVPSPSAAASAPAPAAGGNPTPSSPAVAATGAAAVEPEPPPAPAAPPRVEITEPSFVGPGQVPKIGSILDKTRTDVGKCVAAHGGLTASPKAFLKVQLLVRDRGRAEGVEVLEASGVGDAAAKCVRELLEGKWVGAPTADPAGVMFRYELAPQE